MMQVIDAVAPADGAVPLGMLSDAIAARRVVRLTYREARRRSRHQHRP